MTVLALVLLACVVAVAVIALYLWRHPPPEGCASCGMIGELEHHLCRWCAAENWRRANDR